MDKNRFEYKYFLLVNYLANKMVNMQFQNFAELIKSENEGRFMNSQMTFYFYQLDDAFSELLGNDPFWLFDYLDINELAEIPSEQLENDYIDLCVDDDSFSIFNLGN